MDIIKNLNENDKIRNICILAHVDHGKTTLVDNLISSNKIISDKNIGKIKYLDSREDEQKRQITMKSSSILLTHIYNKNYLNEMFIDKDNNIENESGKNNESKIKDEDKINDNMKEKKNTNDDKILEENKTYLINIIDTPGHVDFSSEVSTCIRICDGSIILIDCIEGICSQTKIVLRQTWKEMIKSILVINKIDKLITNKNMDSISAYEHINNIIEQVNAYIYQLYIEENMNNDSIETSELEKYTYSPIKGNVLLCSSIHCWCVDMNIFSFLFCKKMNISHSNIDKIKKYMWNQYYFNMKEKKILKITNDTCSSNNNIKKKKKNLFSLVVLDFLWKIYDITIKNRDDEKIRNLCSELNISDSFLKKNTQNNIENNTFILTCIMSKFLNISRSIFNTCIEMFPSPKKMDENRLFKIFPSLYNKEIYKNIINCSTDNFTIIYISKYICANLQNNTLVGFKGFYDKNTFLAICRIYSGILYENMILYICGKNIKILVKKIYICMGGDLLSINEAYAGNIVAVYLSLIKENYENNKENQRNVMEKENIESNDISQNSKYYNDSDKKEKREDSFENIHNNINNKILNVSENINKINNQIKSNNEHFINNLGDIDGEDLQYLSNTLMNLIKNKRSKKEYNIFLMNNECIFLNKNVTLSNQENIDSFILPFTDTCSTILHTIVEPKNIQDMNKFLYGLILLYTCDTSIDIDFNERGEYILKFCGEIHMQKCLSDFVNIYSNIEIKTSDANISIREGINDNYMKIKRKKNKIHDNLKGLYNYYLKVQMSNDTKNFENCINNDTTKENSKIISNNDNNNNNNNNNLIKEKNNTHKEKNINTTKMESNSSDNFFKNINLEKDNHFLNILFNYSHNTICNKLNNNSFYVFLSVLNMPENILHFFDKHYSNIQTILENRCISPCFLNYNKMDFSNKSEYFLYKQCLINLEKCVNDLCFSNKVNYEDVIEENINESIMSDSEKKEEKENLAKDNCDKVNFLKKNKNYHLQLWDICVQNGSITLLYIKKYYNKKKNNEYILDNILTNEKYKNIINQRCFVDTYLSDTNNDINIYLNNLCLGFKLASKYGPIAQEPIRGALFIIEGLVIDELFNEEIFEDINTKKENLEEKINPGNIIALMKETCLNSMQQNKLRIFEPMLRLNLTCESSVLGKVYNVLLKRRCSILSEEIKDGYFLYCIDAYLPLFNSFKLSEELRSKCSGNVIYDIQFSHWNKLDEDIFLLSDNSTVIYDEDFDIKLTDNTATEIVNYIRRAKGLVTNEKIIQKPEKQCTLKK
ncbi:elongation factor Tu, putative [Plasmodium gallinaceum]|uniref:Elongation factor Tu, putative n=1 Tax=Plasmodium gallinaceum TaxID=5849 RepID=A0A1J1GSA8_PLAGA|nr:elongation factor Tu, putative [Plasmodium gallinaceum]CRG95189.1 elongation factor Tu, putative [Plasmodium gallinaceum]